jgi:peptide/nickel transport system substrate-binding protein
MAGLLLVLVGCQSTPASSPSGGQSAPPAPSQPSQRTAINIALGIEINALSSDLDISGPQALTSRYVHPFLNAYMVAADHDEVLRPLLAEALPSTTDGTWQVHDDGRMTVTWRIRTGAKWHDGMPITSDDVRFSWEVGRSPDTVVSDRTVARFIDRVETPDAQTFVMHWRQTSYLGNDLGERNWEILPRHVLGDAFAQDAANFANHPYFQQPEAFVGSGPYRPIERMRDSHLTVEAFDGFFLGRPKIDRITFSVIPDDRTAMANLLANAIDISHEAIGYNEARLIQEQWGQNNGGSVLFQPDNARYLQPQARPDVASPAIQDVRVRRAMLHAIDRKELAEALTPGYSTVSNTNGVPGTRVGDAFNRRAVSYAYDPTRAMALLQEAGWAMGGDGLMVRDGEPLRLEYRAVTGPDPALLFPVTQQFLRRAGIEINLREVRSGDLEQFNNHPGLLYGGNTANTTGVSGVFASKNIASPQTRWVGLNFTGYRNGEVDRLVDRLDVSVSETELLDNMADIWRIVTDEVAVMPMFIRPTPYIVRRGITGPIPSSATGSRTWNIHEWTATS